MTDSIEIPAVRTRGLTRVFGLRRALDGVDLDVPPGEFLTLFGPNGAGKTTLLKILCRLSRPTSGEVSILGVDLRGDSGDETLGRIGLVGHASLLYAGLSARENLTFYGRLYGVADPGGRALELLDQVDLRDRADDAVGTFSRGMLQRLSIARALVHDPELLLLDEPYTGLDPGASELLSDRLQEIHTSGRTILMTSHDLALGRKLSTRFMVLAGGRIALDGRPGDLDEEALRRAYREAVS